MPASTSRGSSGRAAEAVVWRWSGCPGCGDCDVCGTAAPEAVDGGGDDAGMLIVGGLLLVTVRLGEDACCCDCPVEEPGEPDVEDEPDEPDLSEWVCVGAAVVAGAAARTVIPAVMSGWTVQY